MPSILRTALPLLALVALAGCTAGTPGGGESPTPDGPCLAGTWQLDVDAFEAEAAAQLAELDLAIDDLDVTGTGLITFTGDGIVVTQIDLRVTGERASTLVDEVVVVMSSGRWAAGSSPDEIALSDWGEAAPGGVVPSEGSGIPVIDYADVSTLSAVCGATTLTLTTVDPPLETTWTR